MSKVRSGHYAEDVVFRELSRGENSQFSSDLYSLLCELRPGLTQQMFHELTTAGHAQGLRFLVALSASGAPVAAAGYRVLITSRGRILYIDDLVTAEKERSRGVAAAVLNELKRCAVVADCARLELDSGVTNTTAHRFYLRNRLDIKAFHFGAAVDES